MKVTSSNIKDITFFGYTKFDVKYCQNLLIGLLDDVKCLNDICSINNQLYIDYIDEHTEYSPERVEPCPDYYGMFRIRFEKFPEHTVGNEMTIEELDSVLCALINFVEFKL